MKNGIMMVNIVIQNIMKSNMPVPVFPAYICPNPGRKNDRMKATNSDFSPLTGPAVATGAGY